MKNVPIKLMFVLVLVVIFMAILYINCNNRQNTNSGITNADSVKVVDNPVELTELKEITALFSKQEEIREYAFDKFREMLIKPKISISPIAFNYSADINNGSITVAKYNIKNHEVEYIVPVRWQFTDNSQKFQTYYGLIVTVDNESIVDTTDEKFTGLARIETSNLVGHVLMSHSMGSCDCGVFTFTIVSGNKIVTARYVQEYVHGFETEESFLLNNVLTNSKGEIFVMALDSPYFSFQGANPSIKIARIPILLKLNTDTGKFEEYLNDDLRKIYRELYNMISLAIDQNTLPKNFQDYPLYDYVNIVGFQSQLKILTEKK